MAQHERFKLIPAVYVVLRDKDNVLLSKRANSGYHDGEYGLVSGHLEGDETATAGLLREAKEEAGITLQASDLNFVHIAHRLGRNDAQERIDLFFEARQWEGEITNMEPDKCSDLSWYPMNALPPQIIPFVKLVLEDIERGMSYSEYETEPL